MSTNGIPITAREQRQLAVITRRLEQVEPVVTAIREAADHLPAADKIAVTERLKHITEDTVA